MGTLSDRELVALLTKSDEGAYAQIYQRYWGVLYRYARRILQNDEEPADIIQDIFVMLWSKRETLELRHSLSAFLYAAVRNHILKAMAHGKVKEKYLTSLAQYFNEGAWTADEGLREQEMAERIEAEIAQLPPKMREVFLLSKKHYLSDKAIAEQLGISAHTVKSQLGNATRALKVKFGAFFSSLILFLL